MRGSVTRFSSLSVFFLFISSLSFSQSTDEIKKTIDQLNRDIDQAVVDKNISLLRKHYGDDFVFTHSTGHVDSKESWIKNIETMGEARFVSRQHDSTVVELHNDVATVWGKLSVVRESKGSVSKYALWYVRVFVLRNKVWQMISHRSTSEVRQ
jgi:ketosteroid isomerase-like protein